MQPGDRQDARGERARQAAALTFAINGLVFASFVSRAPAIRDALGLTNGGLGLLLVSISVGSLVALPLSGSVVGRLGPARTITVTVLVVTAAFAVAALGLQLGSVALAAPALLLKGLSFATWDVAMNVEGAHVERRLARPLMPRFHAAFSLGTVLGAAIGAACSALGIGVAAQLVGVQLAVVGVVLVAVRSMVGMAADPADAGRPSARGAWTEPRTLLIGLMVLCFALAEGIANDWLAIAMVDGYGSSEAFGAVTFGAFVAAMTLGRLFGGALLERLGRPVVLRALAGTVIVGVLVVVFAPSAPWAVAGAAVWGLGASLGFPVGISAAADDERMSTVRVSVVSSIGYTAFLGGPPLIGLLADSRGILDALLLVPVAMAAALLAVGASRPPAPSVTSGREC